MTIETDTAVAILETDELLEALNSVISIPVVPFKNGVVDFEGHATNINYLMKSNNLEGNRRRVVAIAGTSLVHHIAHKDQISLMDVAGRQMAGDGVLMAGVVPNPLPDAAKLVETMSELSRPPDVYLVMPLTGICDPAGLYETYMAFGEQVGASKARLLYYLRASEQIPCVTKLINDSPHFIGVKIGTQEEDVEPMIDGITSEGGMVIWGIGDRSTKAAMLGATGHTSGINIAFAKASEEINNAQRRGEYEYSMKIEVELSELEEIRFRNGRMYNYSAVVEAMHLGGWDDIVAGDGGPFNPRVSQSVSAEVEKATDAIGHYH